MVVVGLCALIGVLALILFNPAQRITLANADPTAANLLSLTPTVIFAVALVCLALARAGTAGGRAIVALIAAAPPLTSLAIMAITRDAWAALSVTAVAVALGALAVWRSKDALPWEIVGLLLAAAVLARPDDLFLESRFGIRGGGPADLQSLLLVAGIAFAVGAALIRLVRSAQSAPTREIGSVWRVAAMAFGASLLVREQLFGPDVLMGEMRIGDPFRYEWAWPTVIALVSTVFFFVDRAQSIGPPFPPPIPPTIGPPAPEAD